MNIPSGLVIRPTGAPFSVPPGWTRGGAIRYAATEQAKADGVCAIIFPHHKPVFAPWPPNPPYAVCIVLSTITLHDAWKAWWFSGPVVPADINLPIPMGQDRFDIRTDRGGVRAFPEPETWEKAPKTAYRMALPGTWADIPAKADSTGDPYLDGIMERWVKPATPPTAPRPGPVWGSTPAPKPPHNPFASKPKNPFDK